VQEKMIPVPSEAVQACSRITGLFRAVRSYFLALYKKIMAVDNGRVPEDKELPYISIGWFPKALYPTREQLIWLQNEIDVLETLQRRIAKLSGWSGIISSKSLRYFNLYKVRLYPIPEIQNWPKLEMPNV
jgi:hypothetical protein